MHLANNYFFHISFPFSSFYTVSSTACYIILKGVKLLEKYWHLPGGERLNTESANKYNFVCFTFKELEPNQVGSNHRFTTQVKCLLPSSLSISENFLENQVIYISFSNI